MNLTSEEKFKLAMNARKLVEDGKGIIAADEKPSSIGKRFEIYGIPNTIENRKTFREMIFNTPNLAKNVSGIILHEETYNQTAKNGKKFPEILTESNISVGIKLDKGLIDFKDDEHVSIGLEDLDLRCKKFQMAHFAKWRSVFRITDDLPSACCILENCNVLAEYAEICQKNKIVPIVEPEFLWDGSYSIERAGFIMKIVLSTLMAQLNGRGIFIPGVLIKTSFCTAGKNSQPAPLLHEISHHTVESLMFTIPCAVPGIVFLSGGHSPDDSLKILEHVNLEKGSHPWSLSYSFGRALTDPMLEIWLGQSENIKKAQAVLSKRIEKCSIVLRPSENTKK